MNNELLEDKIQVLLMERDYLEDCVKVLEKKVETIRELNKEIDYLKDRLAIVRIETAEDFAERMKIKCEEENLWQELETIYAIIDELLEEYTINVAV